MRQLQVGIVLAGVLLVGALWGHDDSPTDIAVARLTVTHGGAGPFAVAGYRMGEDALQKLAVKRGSMDLDITHHSPTEVQWSCIVDGLQASTGASLGKLNLHWKEAPKGQVYSIVRNKKTGRELRYEVSSAFVKQNLNLPYNKLMTAALQALDAKPAGLFTVQ